MEYGSRLRFILLTIVGILFLVLSAWGIISLARNIFNGSDNNNTAVVQKIELADYARANTAAKLTVGGPIVGDDQYVSYEIEVAENFRKITVFKGYEKTIISEKTYDNNYEAYRTFLQALERINYTTKVKGASDDETAACSTGRRFVYGLEDQGETVSRLWSTSCTSKLGSMAGSGVAARALFKAQIPDYKTILVKELKILQ